MEKKIFIGNVGYARKFNEYLVENNMVTDKGISFHESALDKYQFEIVKIIETEENDIKTQQHNDVYENEENVNTSLHNNNSNNVGNSTFYESINENEDNVNTSLHNKVSYNVENTTLYDCNMGIDSRGNTESTRPNKQRKPFVRGHRAMEVTKDDIKHIKFLKSFDMSNEEIGKIYHVTEGAVRNYLKM